MTKFDSTKHFNNYIKALRKVPIDEKTEHTDRAVLQTLLDSFASEFAKGVVVVHEPKRAVDKGAPDFKLTRAASILGYVENKAIGVNLDAALKSAQIKKYRSLSDNILLTDYLHWIWIDGKDVTRCRSAKPLFIPNVFFRISSIALTMKLTTGGGV